MLKHIDQGLPKQSKILFAKPCLVGQVGRDKSMHLVQAIRHGEFPSHCPVLAFLGFGFLFCGNRHAGNAVLLHRNRANRPPKGKLHRSTDLPTVCARGHHRTKGTDIKKILAHPGSGFVYIFAFGLFGISA